MANTAELNMHWWQASNANLKIYLCFGNRDARAYLPEDAVSPLQILQRGCNPAAVHVVSRFLLPKIAGANRESAPLGLQLFYGCQITQPVGAESGQGAPLFSESRSGLRTA